MLRIKGFFVVLWRAWTWPRTGRWTLFQRIKSTHYIWRTLGYGKDFVS